MTEPDVIAAMDKVWSEVCASAAEPQFILVDGEMHEVLTQVMREAEALERVCSPAGLRALFPGLRG